jgi:hypothetical protein
MAGIARKTAPAASRVSIPSMKGPTRLAARLAASRIGVIARLVLVGFEGEALDSVGSIVDEAFGGYREGPCLDLGLAAGRGESAEDREAYLLSRVLGVLGD